MPPSSLLSIGALSALTGVHIKTLRYYDKMGVLPPHYVDPGNGYRYYTPRQALQVDILRFCTLIGIPLRQFSEFATNDGRIRYAELLAEGKKRAKSRIQEIRRILRLLQSLEADMHRCEACPPAPALGSCAQHARTLALRPFDDSLESDAYHLELYRLIGDLRAAGLEAAYECGIALVVANGERSRHIFMEVEKGSPAVAIPGIRLLKLPAAIVQHTRTDAGGIERAESFFPRAFRDATPHLILATERFGGDVSMNDPDYELRCLPLAAGTPRAAAGTSSPHLDFYAFFG